jgi:hypothetical protein
MGYTQAGREVVDVCGWGGWVGFGLVSFRRSIKARQPKLKEESASRESERHRHNSSTVPPPLPPL